EKIFSQRIQIVSNGIPDPCPRFEREVQPLRHARFAVRKKLLAAQPLSDEDLKSAGTEPRVVRVVYLAHCTREEGVFDAVNGVFLAAKRLAERKFPISLRLLVAGTFVSAEERAEFDRLLTLPGMSELVHYFGFVSGETKLKLLREADLFCFPTF